CCFLIFFFQAEDGIRDFHVTGVQTCALPILKGALVINKLVFVLKVWLFESQLNIYFSVRLSISKRNCIFSFTTIGRTFKLCGEIGVITKLPLPGIIIGPPQLKE